MLMFRPGIWVHNKCFGDFGVQTFNEFSSFSFIEKNVRFKLIEGGYHEVHNEFDEYKKPYFDFLKSSLS